MGPVGLGLWLLISGANLSGVQSERVIQVIRSFFEENGVKQAAESDHELLGQLTQMHFAPKDLWGNRDYVFGYGLLDDGSTLLFGWRINGDAPRISLKDLSSIYEDERMTSIQDESDLKKWKRMREVVAGSFIGARKSDLKVTSLYPPNLVTDKSGREAISELFIDSRPLVARFSPASPVTKTKTILGSLMAVPTR